MPHLLVVEALAQTSGILLAYSNSTKWAQGSVGYLSGIDDCRFNYFAVPGDQMLLETHLKKWRHSVARFRVRASVSGNMVAEATIAFIVRPRYEVPTMPNAADQVEHQ